MQICVSYQEHIHPWSLNCGVCRPHCEWCPNHSARLIRTLSKTYQSSAKHLDQTLPGLLLVLWEGSDPAQTWVRPVPDVGRMRESAALRVLISGENRFQSLQGQGFPCVVLLAILPYFGWVCRCEAVCVCVCLCVGRGYCSLFSVVPPFLRHLSSRVKTPSAVWHDTHWLSVCVALLKANDSVNSQKCQKPTSRKSDTMSWTPILDTFKNIKNQNVLYLKMMDGRGQWWLGVMK